MDISLRVSVEDNKTLDGMDQNFMIGGPLKKKAKKQVSLTIDDQDNNA